MTPDWSGEQRHRFDAPISTSRLTAPTAATAAVLDANERGGSPLAQAIHKTRDYLLGQQHADGYWVGELQGDTILESEYVLLLAFLNRGQSEVARKCCNYILQQQLPEGGWPLYPGGPLDVSASVKAYLALKIVGERTDSAAMMRAKGAIRAAGGAEQVNSFTRFYLAMLGIIEYRQCPAVPPELILLPRWMPFNIYEMSAWSRTIVIPLSLLWAHRPVQPLPHKCHINELFLQRPQDLPVTMETSEQLDDIRQPTHLNWDRIFRRLDRLWKALEALRLKPFRGMAIKRATAWMTERFENSDGLGAIFPPIVWSVIALKCLGHSDDAPAVKAALAELDGLQIEENNTIRLQPCKSPVWDTALTTIALRDAGVPREHPAVKQSVKWLLSKEVQQPGDWSVARPGVQPSGWFFEFNNEFYPDTDDTSMVVMALSRCLPCDAGGAVGSSATGDWQTQYMLGDWSPHEADRDVSAVVSGRGDGLAAAREVADSAPVLNAVWRGTRWVMALQSQDGGWGAFDADNTRELFTRVPFADHNAMIDPATADISARILEMCAHLNIAKTHPAVQKAVDFVLRTQEPDGSWYGRWGVNYIYGTWQCVTGLVRSGMDPRDPRIRAAVAWLQKHQQDDGGWGETPASYDDPSLRGTGVTTPSQTAWALLGLLSAGEARSETVRRGIEWLQENQLPDGTWKETEFTGTGFPRVFYLRYHMYRVYFPLMAMARYRDAIQESVLPR